MCGPIQGKVHLRMSKYAKTDSEPGLAVAQGFTGAVYEPYRWSDLPAKEVRAGVLHDYFKSSYLYAPMILQGVLCRLS